MALTAPLMAHHDLIIAALSEAMPLEGLADDDLVALARLASLQQTLASTNVALIAGEIARRSAPTLGSNGLAQRLGHRTPQEFVRVVTKATRRDAATAVRVGLLVVDSPPWLAPVAAAVGSRSLSGASAEAIRSGLGEPTADISPDALLDAAHRLLAIAPAVDPDRVYSLARELRDEIDATGVADRERMRREARAVHFRRLPDGMARLTWTLDPESAALVGELFDRATSPRRGGPRFVSTDDRAAADRVLNDERTTPQLASDVFLELLVHGADSDSSHLLGSGAPALRIVVAETALRSRSGHATVEGSAAPLSIQSTERARCNAVVTEVMVDETGQVLRLGREQRLYSRRQRVALAVRDGGCRWPGCERPPSWCEAHHTRHWARDGGATDVDDGILLCRHHHLLSHNNGWEITHDGGAYWLIPPPDVDAKQTPRRMPSKTAAIREIVRA